MCRLFAVVANEEVDVSFSFLGAERSFRSLASDHPDGWGIGCYPGPEIYKEPENAEKSPRFVRAAEEVTSRLILGHIRKATVGPKTVNNTHPFTYGDWLFTHNGTVGIHDHLRERLGEEYRNEVEGETDSEIFFYWLIQNIEEEGDALEGIHRALRHVHENRDEETTALNFVLTDGERVYAHRNEYDTDDRDRRLFHLTRDISAPGEGRAVLISSERLTDEEWRPVENGELLMIEDVEAKTLRLTASA